MSVDFRATIKMGWLIENDRAYDFLHTEAGERADYFQCIDAYSDNSDYVYGINIAETDYIAFVEGDMMNVDLWEDDENWIECCKQFAKDFPNDYANVKPGFFLCLNVW